METKKYNTDDLIKFINENKSSDEIAIFYGVSGRTIRNWLTKENLQTNVRDKGHNNVKYKTSEQQNKITENLVNYNKNKLNNRIECVCEYCNNNYKVKPSVYKIGTRFCSEKCLYNFIFRTKPENTPRWLGGKSQENQIGRTNLEYCEWRINVFRRDYFTCQKCGSVGKNLNAHHINNWSDYKEQRYLVNNGITLCKDCHKTIHKTYGIKTTEIDLIQFLNKTNKGWKRTNLESF